MIVDEHGTACTVRENASRIWTELDEERERSRRGKKGNAKGAHKTLSAGRKGPQMWCEESGERQNRASGRRNIMVRVMRGAAITHELEGAQSRFDLPFADASVPVIFEREAHVLMVSLLNVPAADTEAFADWAPGVAQSAGAQTDTSSTPTRRRPNAGGRQAGGASG